MRLDRGAVAKRASVVQLGARHFSLQKLQRVGGFSGGGLLVQRGGFLGFVLAFQDDQGIGIFNAPNGRARMQLQRLLKQFLALVLLGAVGHGANQGDHFVNNFVMERAQRNARISVVRRQGNGFF